MSARLAQLAEIDPKLARIVTRTNEFSLRHSNGIARRSTFRLNPNEQFHPSVTEPPKYKHLRKHTHIAHSQDGAIEPAAIEVPSKLSRRERAGLPVLSLLNQNIGSEPTLIDRLSPPAQQDLKALHQLLEEAVI